MRINLICFGKKNDPFIEDLYLQYLKRLKHYTNFNSEFIQVKTKGNSEEDQLFNEYQKVIQIVPKESVLVLLDEGGKQFTSVEFSSFLQSKFNTGAKSIYFIIGSSYGFHKELYHQANDKISLSKMTFTHQMCRIFFVEQLYRALTILKGEKYHH